MSNAKSTLAVARRDMRRVQAVIVAVSVTTAAVLIALGASGALVAAVTFGSGMLAGHVLVRWMVRR